MRELVRIAQPRKIKQIRMNGEVVEVQQIDKIVGMLFVWIGSVLESRAYCWQF